MSKYTIYFIGSQDDQEEEVPSRETVGNKGARCIINARQGYPVPAGFVISAEVCTHYLGLPEPSRPVFLTKYVNDLVIPALKKLDNGDIPMVSVRSSGALSMPGMMDTVLNVLLGTKVAKLQTWRKIIGDHVALDCLCRLVKTYAEVVHGKILPDIEVGGKSGVEASEIKAKTRLKHFQEAVGMEFPKSGRAQLVDTIGAVFQSWNSSRAKAYRKINGISDEGGTAVVIQTMVFGNRENSCSGVLFTRDVNTGENKLMGEWVHGQGEDVVSGTVDPQPIQDLKKAFGAKVRNNLVMLAVELEKEHGDVQDIEFTIEDGKLWLLQSRTAKRTASAAWQIAADFHAEGRSLDHIRGTLQPQHVRDLGTTKVVPEQSPEPAVIGLPASQGIAHGFITKSVKTAALGSGLVLLRPQTVPDDLEGIQGAVGILTEVGGKTSHAAVVARDMNKPAIVGIGKDHGLKDGQEVWFDGLTGAVYTEAPTVKVEGLPYAAQELVDLFLAGKWIRTQDIEEAVKYPQAVLETVDWTPKMLIEALENLITIKSKDTTIMIDLEGASAYHNVADQEAYDALGLAPPSPEDWSEAKLTALEAFAPSDLEGLVTFRVPSFAMAEKIMEMGFQNVLLEPKDTQEALEALKLAHGTSAFLNMSTLPEEAREAVSNLSTPLGVMILDIPDLGRSLEAHLFDIVGSSQ